LHFLLLHIFSAAALSFLRCEASMRSPRPPPRRAHLCRFTICGLFTKKFELYFKGSAASAPTRLPRHLYRSAFGLVKSRFEQTKNHCDFLSEENVKILKNIIKLQVAYPVESTRLLKLSEYATKNSNRRKVDSNKNILIFSTKNNSC